MVFYFFFFTLFISYYLGVSYSVSDTVNTIVDSLYAFDQVDMELGFRDLEVVKYTNLIHNEYSFTSDIFSCFWHFITTEYYVYLSMVICYFIIIKK